MDPAWVTSESSQKLWLLPQKQYEDVLGAVNGAYRGRKVADGDTLLRILNW